MTCLYTFKQIWIRWPRFSKPLDLFPPTKYFILWKPRVPSTLDKSGHRSYEERKITKKKVTKTKDSLDMNLRRNLCAQMDSPWLTKGPNLMNNKSLVVICWRGSSCTQTELSVSLTISYLFHPHSQCQPLKENSGFIFLLMGWDFPCSIRTTQIVSSLSSILTH